MPKPERKDRDNVARIPLHALKNWRRKGGSRGRGGRGGCEGSNGYYPNGIHGDQLHGNPVRVKLDKGSRRISRARRSGSRSSRPAPVERRSEGSSRPAQP